MPVATGKVRAGDTPEPVGERVEPTTLPIPGQRHRDPPARGPGGGGARRGVLATAWSGAAHVIRGRARRPGGAHAEDLAVAHAPREALGRGGARRWRGEERAGRGERGHAGSRGAGCRGGATRRGRRVRPDRSRAPLPRAAGRAAPQCSRLGGGAPPRPGPPDPLDPHVGLREPVVSSVCEPRPRAVTRPRPCSCKDAVCTAAKLAPPGACPSVPSLPPLVINLNAARLSRMLVSPSGLLRKGRKKDFCFLQHCCFVTCLSERILASFTV